MPPPKDERTGAMPAARAFQRAAGAFQHATNGFLARMADG
jgi:hypothetical protein